MDSTMFGDKSSLTYIQGQPLHGPYTYFMDFATSVYNNILEESNNTLEFELQIVENFLKLISGLSEDIKDKDTLKDKYTGDFILDLFYMLKHVEAHVNFAPQKKGIYNYRYRAAIVKQLLKNFTDFISSYKEFKQWTPHIMYSRTEMIDAAERLCQILANAAGMDNIHSLLLCRMQKGEGTTKLLTDRDMAITRYPTHYETISSLKLLPARYNLTHLDYKPLRTLLEDCDIPLNARNVKIQIVAQQIRLKMLEKDSTSPEKARKRMEKKLTEILQWERGLITLNDPRTLWFPLLRFLTMETFEDTCKYQIKRDNPFLDELSHNKQPNPDTSLLPASVRDYFGEDFTPEAPDEEVD